MAQSFLCIPCSGAALQLVTANHMCDGAICRITSTWIGATQHAPISIVPISRDKWIFWIVPISGELVYLRFEVGCVFDPPPRPGSNCMQRSIVMQIHFGCKSIWSVPLKTVLLHNVPFTIFFLDTITLRIGSCMTFRLTITPMKPNSTITMCPI